VLIFCFEHPAAGLQKEMVQDRIDCGRSESNNRQETSTMSFLTHLECAMCGQAFDVDRLWNLCPECGKPLLARYDLEAARRAISPDEIAGREPNLWRYRELLPVRDPRHVLCLGEGFTPLVHATRLGREIGFEKLFIKDEGLNPTGSFKARGLGVAVSRAYELGATALSIPSAGNAAGAMSAYAALAGIPAYVFMPRDVPQPFVAECRALGAQVTLVDGLITDAGRVAAEEVRKFSRFDVSTLKEPYRLEGKKTMGYEIAEQMDWTLPDVIIYPTGGGTGLIGMWKGFDELEELGWIGPKRPRMVTVQSDGCAPMVKAFTEGREFAEPWQGAKTIADGLRVPAAVGDFLILRTLRDSGGTAIAVADAELMEAAELIGRTQGMFTCPEAAAPLAAFHHLRRQDWIGDDETVVLFSTGNGLKYVHLWT
jgi:threonine synthase